MKKKILVLFVSFCSLMAMATPGDDVSSAVQKNFETKFGKNTEVSWKHFEDVYIGYFMLNGEIMHAYFYDDGEFMGTGKSIEKGQLNETAKAAINKKFEGCWIQQVYELTLVNQAPQHYLILGNMKFTAIIKVDQQGFVQVVQKQKNKLSMQPSQTAELNGK